MVNDIQTLPLISGQIEFLLPKDAQCSETVLKTILLFFGIFSFNKICILSFWELRDFSTKISDLIVNTYALEDLRIYTKKC